MTTLSESVLLAIRESSGSEEELFKQDVQELMKALQEENEFQDEDDLIDAVHSEINKAFRLKHSHQDIYFRVSKKYLKNVVYHWEEIGYSGWITKMAEEAIGGDKEEDGSLEEVYRHGDNKREDYFKGVPMGSNHHKFRIDVFEIMNYRVSEGDDANILIGKVKKELENKVINGKGSYFTRTSSEYLEHALKFWDESDSAVSKTRWIKKMAEGIIN